MNSNDSIEKHLPNEFLLEFSPQKSYSIFKSCNTIERCIRADVPALSTIRKIYSENFVEKYIELWICALNEFLNIKHEMNPAQIQETAKFIYDDFYYLNIADLNLIFTNIKRGKYGKIYDSMDGTKLMEWINKYVEERLEISLNCGGVKKIIDLGLIGSREDVKMIGK